MISIEVISLVLIPIIGIIVQGPEVDFIEDSSRYWIEYMYSDAEDTGGTVASYNPGAAANTVLEAAANPKIGPVISFYDPEIQALLAFE